MSIFSENIQSELPLETVFGIRFHKALDNALIDWYYKIGLNKPVSFERVVQEEICNQFGSVFINRRKYELIDSKINIKYNDEIDGPIKANVSFFIDFRDHTGHGKEHKCFEFEDIVVL